MDRTARLAQRRDGPTGLLLAALAVLALLAAACGASTTATPTPAPPADGAAVVSRAAAVPMDQVKVNIGLKTSGDSPITIDPKQIEVVVDTKNGKGTFHMSVPKAALGKDANAIPIAGDTIDLDALFDGQAVYVKSPLAATLLPLVFLQSGQPVPGDLTGWIKLGTADELSGMLGSLGAGASVPPMSSMPAMASLTPDELKQKLADAGITVTYVGTENRNGIDSDHLTFTVDPSKLEGSDIAGKVPAGALGQLKNLAGEGTLSGDLWFDRSSGRINEADINHAGTDGKTATVTILFSDPGAVSIEAPSGATEVPLTPLIQALMQLGGSMIPGASANP
jgi:hypothetical protein